MRRAALLTLALSLSFGSATWLTSCNPAQVDRTTGARWHHGDGLVGRFQAALEAAPVAQLSFDGAERISGYEGALLVDSPDKVKGLSADLDVRSLSADASLMAALQTRDEASVAKQMRDAGVRVLLLNLGVTESIDRGGSVLSRLYHHDHLSYFSLLRVGDGLLYYKVLDAPYMFPPDLARVSMKYLRARLAGQPPMRFPEIESEDKLWTFVAVLRRYGQEQAVAFAQDKSLQKALEELVSDLEREHRRYVEIAGARPIRDEIGELQIELHRVVERAYIEPRSESFLQDYWEMGIDGAFMMTADRKERATLPGASSFTRSIRSADGFLRAAASQGHMSERRPWRDSNAWLESYRTIHYTEGLGGEDNFAYLYRGVPAVPMSQVSIESVRQGIIHAGDWYLANMHPDGYVVYKMWPSDNRYSDEYNLVRHTLATWNLVQAWQMDTSRTDFLAGARRALDFTQRFLVHEDDPKTGKKMAYYTFNNNQKLGTVVVNLLGIVDLARATNSHEWDEQLKLMGNFILFMQEDNGRFNGYHVAPDHPYYQAKNDIVPGEAALALIYLAEYFNDDAWIATLPKYFEYYQPWFRSRAVKGDVRAPWPKYTYDNDTRLDLVQFGPWTVMAANAYYRRTGNTEAAAFGLEIARWMIDSYEWTDETAPFPDYVGGYYKMPDELPAMQAFCYAEGTAAAYQLALKFRPEEAPYFEQHTRESMRFALQMQYNDYSTYAFSRPDQVDGGIRYAMNETKVRIDYVHHALSAMYQWVNAAQQDESLAASIRTGGPLPIQKTRMERLERYRAAELANDTDALEAARPPWGEDRRAVPLMTFKYPQNPALGGPSSPPEGAGNGVFPESDDEEAGD